MTEEEAREAIELFEEAGLEPFAYSGRGMFGARCVAVRTGGGTSLWSAALTLMDAALAVKGEEPGELVEWLGSFGEPRSDSLGQGTVLYWPELRWPEKERA